MDGVDGVDGVDEVDGMDDVNGVDGVDGFCGAVLEDSRRAIRSSVIRMVFWIEARSRRIWTRSRGPKRASSWRRRDSVRMLGSMLPKKRFRV